MARGRNSFGSNGKLPADRPKVKINKENIREALVLFKYVKPYRGILILSLVFIALSTLTTSLFPVFLGRMIDAVLPGTALPGMDSAGVKGSWSFNIKNVHWSLQTAVTAIFIVLGIQTFFSYMRVYLL